MARIKGGLNARKKHNRVLKLAKGYRGARSKQYRIADIQALCEGLADASSQKVSALVKRMRDNVLVSREVVKGTAYFTKI